MYMRGILVWSQSPESNHLHCVRVKDSKNKQNGIESDKSMKLAQNLCMENAKVG